MPVREIPFTGNWRMGTSASLIAWDGDFSATDAAGACERGLTNGCLSSAVAEVRAPATCAAFSTCAAGAPAEAGIAGAGSLSAICTYSSFERTPLSKRMRAIRSSACCGVAAPSICFISSGVRMPLRSRISASGSWGFATSCCAFAGVQSTADSTRISRKNERSRRRKDKLQEEPFILESPF